MFMCALAAVAVTLDTVIGKDLGARRNILTGGRVAVEGRPDIIGNRLDLRRLQRPVRPEPRHLANARIRIGAADAVSDRLLNIFQRAAPDPRPAASAG
jgi:hypothetical protein